MGLKIIINILRMKSTFAIACMAATTQANIFSDVKAAYDNFPVTKQEARERFTVPRNFKMTPAHAEAYKQAHHNVRAQRERLGLAPIGARPDEDMRKSYEDMTGLTALVLGMAQGLMYNAAAGQNSCFSAIESGLTASSNFFFVLSKMYMPWYVPEAQLVIQDNVALLGGFYTDCDINKFFDSMTTLISSEGLATLGSRAGGSYFFEFSSFKEMRADPMASTFVKAEKFGKLFGAVTNYHI